MIFYKASFVNNRRHLHERTVDILKAVSAQTGWAPQDISVTGSSNGGYSALYLAALIMKDFNIRAENVLILDMGNLWCYTELLISKEEAAPMIDANTTVYAFSKVNNIYGTAPSRSWLTYGVHTMEVACVNWDHDGITKMALRNGTLSWAIGEQDELDPDWYTINPIDPSYTTVT